MSKIILILLIALSLSFVAFAQDFEVNRMPGEPYNLSGMNSAVFDRPFFQMEGWKYSDVSFSLTASQSAFLNAEEDKAFPEGYVPKKHAYVGSSVPG